MVVVGDCWGVTTVLISMVLTVGVGRSRRYCNRPWQTGSFARTEFENINTCKMSLFNIKNHRFQMFHQKKTNDFLLQSCHKSSISLSLCSSPFPIHSLVVANCPLTTFARVPYPEFRHNDQSQTLNTQVHRPNLPKEPTIRQKFIRIWTAAWEAMVAPGGTAISGRPVSRT